MERDRRRVVAIIDDDAAIRDAFRLVLELAAYPVATYPLAIAFLADTGANPACLILDHHMPQMTGLELVAQMRRKGMHTPVLLVTSDSSPAIIAQAIELGIEKVVTKPPGEDELLEFVAVHC